MKRNSLAFLDAVLNFTGKPRRETIDGREFLVVPVTMLRQGVLNGSKGRLFYPRAEIARTVSDWERIPLTLRHPTCEKTGRHLSAADPGVLNRLGLGFVRNVKLEDADGNVLQRAEACFDVAATQRICPATWEAVSNGRKVEVSTGLYTDNEPAEGTWNGEAFDYIARNFRPDHLAVLPDEVGACSVADGCGIHNALRALAFLDAVGASLNALPNQPKSKNTGRFKAPNAGTGKGDTHQAAQDGFHGKPQEDDHEGCECGGTCDECQTKNANPEGCNQHTGPGCGGGGVHTAVLLAIDSGRVSESDFNSHNTGAQVARDNKSIYVGRRVKIDKSVGGGNGFVVGFDKDGSFAAVKVGNDIKSFHNSDLAVNTANHRGSKTMKLNPKQRKEVIDFLVKNTTAWKGGRELLEDMPDAQLASLGREARDLVENKALVTNATALLEEEGYARLDEPTDNGGFFAKKDEEEVEDEEEEDDEEEETVKNRRKQKPSPAANRAPVKQPTYEQWMASAPPRIQSVVRNAEKVEREAKEKLVKKLTANSKAKDKERQTKLLMNKELAELEELAGMIVGNAGNDQPERRGEPIPSWLGAGGAAEGDEDLTGNADESSEDDLLPLPTMNYGSPDDDDVDDGDDAPARRRKARR